MKQLNITNQNGTTMFLLLVFLVGMFGFIGLATDSGHLLINKTRLQNAMDAAALSAAITLNYDANRSMDLATTQGKETFDLFKAAAGNGELSSVSRDDLTFEYSRTLNPFTPITGGSTEKPAFVRVSTSSLAVSPILIQVISSLSGPVNVYSISTAGLEGANCNLVPLVICPTEDEDGELIVGCDDEGCNGIPFHTRVCLKGGTEAAKTEACQDGSLPNGNFGLLRFEGMSGGSDIRDLLEGSVDTCSNNATWENGNKVGPVSQGIDTRFSEDKVTGEYIPTGQTPDSGPTNLYKDHYSEIYNQAEATNNDAVFDNPDGKSYNRVVQVPVATSCSETTVEWQGRASCLFMNQEAVHTGTSNEIYGELLDYCPGIGKTISTNPVFYGPTKVVIYKTDGSGDS